jgi:hypothetical protein
MRDDSLWPLDPGEHPPGVEVSHVVVTSQIDG